MEMPQYDLEQLLLNLYFNAQDIDKYNIEYIYEILNKIINNLYELKKRKIKNYKNNLKTINRRMK